MRANVALLQPLTVARSLSNRFQDQHRLRLLSLNPALVIYAVLRGNFFNVCALIFLLTSEYCGGIKQRRL